MLYLEALQKQSEYEKAITMQNDKLKEYRNKITMLKTKINELYNEINYYKNSNGFERNRNEYLGPFVGNRLNPNIMSPFLKNDSIDFLGLNNTPENNNFSNQNEVGQKLIENKIIAKEEEGKKEFSGGKKIKDEDK